VHLEAMTPGTLALAPRLAPTVARHRFVLAGGTSLALLLGHRLSVDLDFFSEDEVLPDLLMGELRAAHLDPEVQQLAPGTFSVLIEGVRVSFSHYPYPFVDAPQPYEGLAVASILDVAAMKLIAIAQRSARRDFVDLYVILQHAPFRDVAARAVQRYGAGMVEPVAIGKGLTWFEVADGEPDPQYLKRALKWEDVRGFFAANFRQFVLDLDAALGSAGK
jgi:hypothetical protein